MENYETILAEFVRRGLVSLGVNKDRDEVRRDLVSGLLQADD